MSKKKSATRAKVKPASLVGSTIDFKKVTVKTVTPTEVYFRKRDTQGKEVVNNHFPGCFVVNCEYGDNPDYTFIVTEKELDSLGVSKDTPAESNRS